jgi:hypothetical protein
MSKELVKKQEEEVQEVELVEEEPVDESLSWLSVDELACLTHFRDPKNYCRGGSTTVPIAPSVAEQLFTLYLAGKSLTEIRRLNHQYYLGQIVDAAVSGNWHIQRQQYLSELSARSADRLKQTAMECVDFMADQLSVTHKMHGDALKKYLQTGNPTDLGSFGSLSPTMYKSIFELLLKASGADRPQNNITIKGDMINTTAPVQKNVIKKTLAERTAEKKSLEKVS